MKIKLKHGITNDEILKAHFGMSFARVYKKHGSRKATAIVKALREGVEYNESEEEILIPEIEYTLKTHSDYINRYFEKAEVNESEIQA